jgi:hypothetical protein
LDKDKVLVQLSRLWKHLEVTVLQRLFSGDPVFRVYHQHPVYQIDQLGLNRMSSACVDVLSQRPFMMILHIVEVEW